MKPEPTAAQTTAGTTVEFQVRFAAVPKGRKQVRAAEVSPTPPVARPARPVAPVAPPPRAVAVPTPVVTPTAKPAQTPRVPKITLLLVLGHHFERLVRDGVVRDYAEIGRRTGLTRGRVTQIVNLTLLAPEIQERILETSDGELPVERRLRELNASASWTLQRRPWRNFRNRRST